MLYCGAGVESSGLVGVSGAIGAGAGAGAEAGVLSAGAEAFAFGVALFAACGDVPGAVLSAGGASVGTDSVLSLAAAAASGVGLSSEAVGVEVSVSLFFLPGRG